MNIAILTARGGSKRIPRKNIRPFMGKPMLAWPIEAARETGLFAHILVSTDDEEIAAVARDCGAEVPFLRPAALADDFTHAHKAARHMLEWALTQWRDIPHFAHIYPTAPLLRPEDIRAGYELMRKGKLFAYTAQRLSFPIYQTVTLGPDDAPLPLFPPEKAAMRSQDMPAAYIDAGQLYWYAVPAFLAHETAVPPANTALIPMPPERALDIDTEEDWVRAEQLARLSK